MPQAPEDYGRDEDQVEIALTSLATDDGLTLATREQIEARLNDFYPLRRWWRRLPRRWLLGFTLETLEHWGKVKKEPAVGPDGRKLDAWRLSTVDEYRAHVESIPRKPKTPEQIARDLETERRDTERREVGRRQLGQSYEIVLEQQAKAHYLFVVRERWGVLADNNQTSRDPTVYLYAFSEFGSETDPSGVPRLMAEYREADKVRTIGIHDIQTGGRINQGYGSALLRALFAVAEQLDVERISGGISYVDTVRRRTNREHGPLEFDREHLDRIVAFYRKHGFEVTLPSEPGEWGRVV
jgi:GNAT superfamily N-acetyltransferase